MVIHEQLLPSISRVKPRRVVHGDDIRIERADEVIERETAAVISPQVANVNIHAEGGKAGIRMILRVGNAR